MHVRTPFAGTISSSMPLRPWRSRMTVRRSRRRKGPPGCTASRSAERNPKERLTALFHHITPDALHRAYLALRRDAAAGVDGITWDMYGKGLEERLLDLHRRLHSGGAYRAPPVRRVEIPKPDGGTRPLGIASLEDKIVQKAVVDVIHQLHALDASISGPRHRIGDRRVIRLIRMAERCHAGWTWARRRGR